MALVLTDGFETYPAGSSGVSIAKWNSCVGTIQSDAAVTGSFCLRSSGSGGAAITKLLEPADESATVAVGSAIKQNSDEPFDAIIFKSDAGATEHVVIRRVAGGAIAIDRGATQVAISSTGILLSDSVWRYVEAVATLHDSTGQVDVYVNGSNTPAVSFTGDTKNGGTATVFDTVALGGFNFGVCSNNDDIYIVTAAGSAPTGRLGQVRCWPLLPSGNGNSSQLVGSDANSVDNYLLVDEGLASPSTADYVGSATDGQKDTYTYTDLTPATGTVLAVTVASLVLKTDSGVKSIRPVIRSGGTDYGGTDVILPISAETSRQEFRLNPATSAAWTIAEVNSAEFGVEVRP